MTETELLSKVIDQRIEITGIFDRYGDDGRGNRTALLQEVYAHVEGRTIDLDHKWLQNVESFVGLEPSKGDRIKCTTRVRDYRNENKLSLTWPLDVAIIQYPKHTCFRADQMRRTIQVAEENDLKSVVHRFESIAEKLERLLNG